MVDEETNATLERNEPVVDVNAIYRTPLTARERLANEKRRSKEAYERRRPRHPSLRLGIASGALALSTLLFFNNLEPLFASGSIALTSLAFLIALILLLQAWFCVRYAARVLYFFNLSPSVYFFFATCMYGVSIGTGLHFAKSAGSLLVLCAVFCGIITLTTKLFLTVSKQENQE